MTSDRGSTIEVLDTLRAPDRIPAFLNLILLIAATTAAATLLWWASHGGSMIQTIVAAVAFSYVNNTIFALLHEAVHGQFHPRPWVNEWCGRIAAGFFPTSFSMQRSFHLGHHQRNRTAVEQFDYLHPGDNKFFKYAQWYSILTGLYWCFVPLGCLAYFLLPWVFRLSVLRSERSKLAQQSSVDAMFGDLEKVSPAWVRGEVIFSAALQFALIYSLDLSLFGWAVCYAAFALNWSGLQYADHAWSKLDVRDGAWNLRVNPVVRYLFLNYHHHLAHHQRPEVPWIHLPRYVDGAEARPWFVSLYLSMWLGPRPISATDSTLGGVAMKQTPARETFVVSNLKIGLFFTLFFYANYYATNWLTDLHGYRVPIHFGFETRTPFLPEFAILYVSLYLLMGLLPFALHSRDAIRAVALVLTMETVVAALCFVFLPVINIYGRPLVSGVAGAVFDFADLVNLDHNFFPSLHVAFAWTSAGILATRCAPFVRVLLLSWALGISLSTLLTHQHYLADIAGGVVLAMAGIRLYQRASVGAGSRRLRAELTCLRLNLRFARRHRRYLVIFLIIYGSSLLRWRITRAVRFAYGLAQHVDDVLDGDYPCEREPLEFVDEMIGGFESHKFDESDLGNLARCAADELKALRGSVDDPLTELQTLFRVMRFDRERARDRLLLTRQRLEQQHWETFYHSVNLMLVVARANVRADDAVDLIKAFGWCSTMRDLREDIDRGLINVPLEVVDQARAQGALDLTYDSLTATPAVGEWIRAEHAGGKRHLDRFALGLAALGDRKGTRILAIFLKSMYGFHKRFINGQSQFFTSASTPVVTSLSSEAKFGA